MNKLLCEEKEKDRSTNSCMIGELRKGLVSVIVPSYNARHFIEQSLCSIMDQSYGNLELIFVDDASTDGTNRFLNSLAASEPRIRRVANKQNLGVAASRNKALKLAMGQFVAFLDADDIWLQSKLERQLEFMQSKNAAFCFTAYEVCDLYGLPSGQVVDMGCPDEVGYRDMLAKRATLGTSTVMIDRSRLGSFEMPLLTVGEDYALWLELLKTGCVAHRMPEVLARHRIVPGSLSDNKARKAVQQWLTYRRQEGLPLVEAGWYFANYFYRAIRRV